MRGTRGRVAIATQKREEEGAGHEKIEGRMKKRKEKERSLAS